MINKEFFIYLLIMAGSTYLIRTIPFAIFREKINNQFIRSFLYYIPYTVLSAMTFPAALYATGNTYAAAVGLLVAILLAIKEKGLLTVAAASCIAVYISDLILSLI